MSARPIRRGEPWERPASGSPDVEVAGGDADIARMVIEHPGGLVRLRDSVECDLARAVGLGRGAAPGHAEVTVDLLLLEQPPVAAVNMVVLGTAPDRLWWGSRSARVSVALDGREGFDGRATTVLVASGQFLRGADVVPRGHPGDGRVEVQVYRLRPGERAPMRRRLRDGAHVPHPRIVELAGRRVEARVDGRPFPLEVDGRSHAAAAHLGVAVAPAAFRLLV